MVNMVRKFISVVSASMFLLSAGMTARAVACAVDGAPMYSTERPKDGDEVARERIKEIVGDQKRARLNGSDEQ